MTMRGAAMCPLSLPPVIGHRGAAAYAPENTLAGFRAAKALGCRWVEFDVRLTADGAPVICHDDELRRTTDRPGRISTLPLAEVRRCDAGRWFGEKFAGERVPILDEALRLCGELGLGANIEIKAEPGLARATAAAVAACLDQPYGQPAPVLISSFVAEAVAEAAERAPRLARAMLWREIPKDWAAVAERLGCATVNADQSRLTESMVAEVRSAGYPLLAFTVNEPARARQLFRWGVASVFSDVPDIIAVDEAAEGRPGVHC